MHRVRSFLSEHTVEFTLIPRMAALLRRRFAFVLPMTYSKTREGNATASTVHFDQGLRVIALFPRRPKIARNCPKIYGKINSQLFEFARASRDMGIPVFAGLPVVASLWELSDKTKVVWFRVEGSQRTDTEFSISQENSKTSVSFICGQPIQIASDREVLDLTESHTQILSWPDARELLDTLRKIAAACDTRRSLYGPVYKPIYFLMPEDRGASEEPRQQ